MGALIRFTLSGPGWWVNLMNELHLRLQREVAAGKLKLPLTITDDATDGQFLYVEMKLDGDFDAKGTGLTQDMFPGFAATIFSDGKKYPLKI